MSDELKIIMDTIAQLGQAGKEAFIWWLIVKYALNYLSVMFCISAIVVGVRIVVGRIASLSLGNQLGRELGNLLKVADSGVDWDNEYRRAQVKSEIIQRVRKLQEKE